MGKLTQTSVFKCFTHEVGFDSPEEMRNHQANEIHSYSGETACKDCGVEHTPIIFTGKLANGSLPPAYCEDCKARLRRELN